MDQTVIIAVNSGVGLRMILEKVLPDVKSVELERLEDFLRSKI